MSTAVAHAKEKLERHFNEDLLHMPADGKKRWDTFRRNTRGRAFTEAVHLDPRADEKLKRFTNLLHLRANDKVPGSRFKGKTGTYTVRYHPSIERHSCTCGDWTFNKAVNGGDCRHIKAMIMRTKTAASPLEAIGRLILPIHQRERAEKSMRKHDVALAQMREVHRARAKTASFFDVFGRAAARIQAERLA